MFLVVAYDVPAKRTEIYRKLLARYLSTTQFSVFSGDLTEVLYRELRQEIDEVRIEKDNLVFIQTANRRNIQVEVIKKGIISKDTSHFGSGMV